MKKKVLPIIIVIVVVVMIVAVIIIALCGQNGPEKVKFSDKYEKETIGCDIVIISEQLNVRSEPLKTLQTKTAYAGTEAGAAGFGIDTVEVDTSYGKLRDVGSRYPLYLAVSQVYMPIDCTWDDCCHDGGDAANGPFVGIAVDDIVNLKTWTKYFPTGIENDPDEIVWISAKFGTVKYGTVDLY